MLSHNLAPAILLVFTSLTNAQRPAIMNGFAHDGRGKQFPNLDWAGLYTPLPQYEDWWKEVAHCAHVRPSMMRINSVQFYYVNAVDFAPRENGEHPKFVVGATYATFEQIYIAVRHITRPTTVKHEMMHQALFWARVRDWNSDERPEFKRCGLEMRREDQPGAREL